MAFVRLVVVAASPDCVAHRSEEPQGDANNQDDRTDCPKRCETGENADDEKDHSNDDHFDSIVACLLLRHRRFNANS